MSLSDGDEGVGYNRQNLDASLQLQHDAEVLITPALQTTSCLAGLKTDFIVAAARAERWQGVKQRPLGSTSLRQLQSLCGQFVCQFTHLSFMENALRCASKSEQGRAGA